MNLIREQFDTLRLLCIHSKGTLRAFSSAWRILYDFIDCIGVIFIVIWIDIDHNPPVFFLLTRYEHRLNSQIPIEATTSNWHSVIPAVSSIRLYPIPAE